MNIAAVLVDILGDQGNLGIAFLGAGQDFIVEHVFQGKHIPTPIIFIVHGQIQVSVIDGRVATAVRKDFGVHVLVFEDDGLIHIGA